MSLKIANVQLNNNLILAPMAGYGDVAFRKLCKDYGVGLTVTEMISVKGLLYQGKKTVEMLRTADSETPSCVQLFGSEPDEFYKVISQCRELDSFDIIDINMGCPVPKVTKQGEGSALMKDPVRAGKIVEACKKATSRPVTTKFRLGWSENTSKEFAHVMQESGADMVTVHGRTTEQLYRGESNVEAVLSLKPLLNIPLTVSGDINEHNLDRYKGADGLMIGRGAIGHADIFSVINGGEEEEIYPLIKKHIRYMQQYFDNEHYIVANMRKHFAYYLKRAGVKGEDKNRVNLAPTLKDLFVVLDEIFKVE